MTTFLQNQTPNSSIEISKSVKGIYSRTRKVNDLEDTNAVERINTLAHARNKKPPTKTPLP